NPDKMTKEDVNVKDICPAAQGAKNHQPASYDPKSRLFYVGTNHICMDYQAFSVKYRGGFPYVGATLSMFPADHGNTRGRLIAFDSVTGQTKWAVNETFQVYSGPLTTDAGNCRCSTGATWWSMNSMSMPTQRLKRHGVTRCRRCSRARGSFAITISTATRCLPISLRHLRNPCTSGRNRLKFNLL